MDILLAEIDKEEFSVLKTSNGFLDKTTKLFYENNFEVEKTLSILRSYAHQDFVGNNAWSIDENAQFVKAATYAGHDIALISKKVEHIVIFY